MMNLEASIACRAATGATATAVTVNLDFRGNVRHVTSMRTLATQPPMKKASASAFIRFVASTEGSLLKRRRIVRSE